MADLPAQLEHLQLRENQGEVGEQGEEGEGEHQESEHAEGEGEANESEDGEDSECSGDDESHDQIADENARARARDAAAAYAEEQLGAPALPLEEGVWLQRVGGAFVWGWRPDGRGCQWQCQTSHECSTSRALGSGVR